MIFMPYPPYHLGASGFFGLLFRRWLDVPVFVLANVIVDLEVLADHIFQPGWPVHRFLHFHTLLAGAAVGIVWGLAVYFIKPVRRFFQWIMKLLQMPYKVTAVRAAVSGMLGVWLHVFIDNLFHYDVQMLWPSRAKPLWKLLGRWHIRPSEQQIEYVCAAFMIGAVLLYILILATSRKKQNR